MTFKELILSELKLAESNRDPELGAILTGALKQHEALVNIINTKKAVACAGVASEAYTWCNELAENVERIRNEESKQTAARDTDATESKRDVEAEPAN